MFFSFEFLIAEVRARPLFTSTTRKGRSEAWREIATALPSDTRQFSADFCKDVWEKERKACVAFRNKTSSRTTYEFTSEMSWYQPKVTNVVVKLPQKPQQQPANNEDSEVEEDETPVEAISNEVLVKAATAALSTELIGDDADFVANLCVEAVQLVRVTNANNKVTYPISTINTLKSQGKAAHESQLDVESKTLTLCGPNDILLVELEEQVKYAMWIIKRCLEAGKLKTEDELAEEAQESLIDVRYHSGGTYAIVDWLLLKKLRKNVSDGEDSSILSKAVVKFGMVYAYSFEARWSSYKNAANGKGKVKSAFMGTSRYKMIPIRQWTADMQLAARILNNGHAAFVDEFVLHALDIEKNELFSSKAGNTGIQQFNLSAIEVAKDKKLQAEVKALLFDALLNKEAVGDQARFLRKYIPCLYCSARFLNVNSASFHVVRGVCPKTRDPYTKYKEAERKFPTDRTVDYDEPPTKKAHEELEIEIPKGTQDYGSKQVIIRKQALDQLAKIFENHGAEAIDRSDIESTGNLLGEYGEKGGNLSKANVNDLLEELKKRLNAQ
ncbi:CCT-alpha [Aphelenchoides bicaudatus]|nr:CCT-alpha [Aphelenchoides bicaudatus]